MSRICVWAYKKLPVLNNVVGFVEVDQLLGTQLIESGEVQDPQVGGNHLKHIDYSDPVVVVPPIAKAKQYKTKVLTPEATE